MKFLSGAGTSLSSIPLFFWLHWSFLLCTGFLSCGEQGSTLYLQCMGFSLRWLLLLQSTCSGAWASVAAVHSAAVAHRLRCSVASRIFPDRGSNPRALHWQVDSYLLYHQGRPLLYYLEKTFWYFFKSKSLVFLYYFSFCLSEKFFISFYSK